MMKLRFNGGKIGKNIGVIKLQIIKNDGTWMIMNKLRAFIKESGVVFIRLNNKKWRIS